MKECSKCNEVKPLDSYGKDKSKKDGRLPNCKECKKEYDKQNHLDNKDKHHSIQKEYRLTRRKNDLEYRLMSVLQNGLLRAYKKKKIKEDLSQKNVIKHLGCTLPEFISYIENKFIDEMSWSNYGEWHLDHIVPILALEKEELTIEQIAHFTNYQPLWMRDNLKKELDDFRKYLL